MNEKTASVRSFPPESDRHPSSGLKKHLKRSLPYALSLLCVLSSCGSKPEETSLEIDGFAMATSYSIVIPGIQPDSSIEARLRTEIPAAIAQTERRLSIFEPESEISRFNATSTTNWFPVSRETADVVSLSLEVSRATGGAFDITVGRAVETLILRPDEAAGSTIFSDSVPNAADTIGYGNLAVNFSPPSLRKSLPEIRLDLSGVAKGYSVDRVSRIIESFDLHRYKVEIGGEIRTAGHNPDGDPWRIGIASPARSDLQPVLLLTDAAVATSGDYRNYQESDNRQMSHFIDPGTGRPIERKGLSVTVAGNECARVDAIATALAVLGPDKAYALAMERNWKAYFIYYRDGGWMEQTTAAMKPLFRMTNLSGNYPDSRKQSVYNLPEQN